MCGIAGIISLCDRPVENGRSRIDRMIKMLHHRGPDARGAYISEDEKVVLGNTRLSIVDVKTDFEVPMKHPATGSVLTYNGEIFNYKEVRDELKLQGENFQTQSDTEVMLRGLQANGDNFLGGLDGFWGFAFYDKTKNRVLLSRDLIGEKQVFYTIWNDEFIFASEVNAVLEVAIGMPLKMDVSSVVSSFQFRVTPPGKTLLEGVHKMKPGRGLYIQPGRNEIKDVVLQKFDLHKWKDFFSKKPSEEEILEVYEQELSSACSYRIPTDVGYISTLSGGIDSAAVNIYSSDRGKRKISSLFGHSSLEPRKRGSDLSEAEASRFTSKKLNTEHHEFNMIDEDSLELYPKIARNAFDGMICEGLVSVNQLAKETRRLGKKVLLLSDGPDEMLGGYEVDFQAFRLEYEMRKSPLKRSFWKGVAKNKFGRKVFLKDDPKNILNWSYLENNPFLMRPNHGGTNPDLISSVFEPQAVDQLEWGFGVIPDIYKNDLSDLDLSQKMALAYVSTTLPDYINLRTDRAAMYESVEPRFPMQSKKLVEMMISTPEDWRFKGGKSSKYLLRKLVDRNIGKEVAYRSKYGFAYPSWIDEKNKKKLGFAEQLRKGEIFQTIPFAKNAEEFFLKPGNDRLLWFGYCLNEVNTRIKNRDFQI